MNFRELPPLTNRQEQILILIYRFRFINRHQLQHYFNHKDARRINTWLRDLVAKNYLGRIYSHTLLENTKPAIYYLNNNGIVWIRYNMGDVYQLDGEPLDIQHMKKFYQDKKASDIFIKHNIALFQLFLQLKDAEEKDAVEYEVQTKTERWIYQKLDASLDFDEEKEYIPDLFVYKTENPLDDTMTSSTYCIELFDSHVPRYAILYRVKQYIQLIERGEWDMYTGFDGMFPHLLFIFPHQQKINLVTQAIRELLWGCTATEQLMIFVTTYKKAMDRGILHDSNIWQQIREEADE